MSRFTDLQKKFKFEGYTGFGSGVNNQGDRLFNKDGSFNVKRSGQSLIERISPFHQLITMSWGHLLLLILGVFTGLNLIFTCVYYLIGLEELTGLVQKDSLGIFVEVFSFSAQTLTTVGYGRVNPVDDLASLLASFEALSGLMSFALLTGILYGRFSRPNAKLLFSESAVFAPFQNSSALMFRIANQRKNQLIECEANVLFNYHDKETGNRRFINIDLEYSKINALSLSWTIVHPIDEKSPMFGLSKAELQEMNPEIILMFKAYDDTYAQMIHTRHSYTYEEMIWGAKFVPMYKRAANGKATELELHKIGQIQPADLPN